LSQFFSNAGDGEFVTALPAGFVRMFEHVDLAAVG
jgi:hypothetical protein